METRMAGRNIFPELPIPRHYDPQKAAHVWRVPYQEHSLCARQWAAEHAVPPAIDDQFKIALLGIDIQNTFCIPGYDLFAAGQFDVVDYTQDANAAFQYFTQAGMHCVRSSQPIESWPGVFGLH